MAGAALRLLAAGQQHANTIREHRGVVVASAALGVQLDLGAGQADEDIIDASATHPLTSPHRRQHNAPDTVTPHSSLTTAKPEPQHPRNPNNNITSASVAVWL